MASSTLFALRQELEAALSALNPQIRGLEDLAKVSLSAATLAFVTTEITDHIRRRDLCKAVIATLDRLEEDNYPDMPKAEVPESVFQELQEQQDDIAAALSEFAATPQATVINVTVGSPVPKPGS